MRLVNRACLLANKGLNQIVFWWHYRCPDGSLAKFCKEPEVLGRKGTEGNPWASSSHLHSTENCHVMYQTWDTMFITRLYIHWEESGKYDAQRSIVRRTYRSLILWCLILLLKVSYFIRRNQGCKKQEFHLISKHSLNIHFLCFFMNKKHKEEAPTSIVAIFWC